jgi:hypothetical protein
MTAATPTTTCDAGLVRLSPAHPLWHLEIECAPTTYCGRDPREDAERRELAEPLPTPRCSVCGPRMEAALAKRPRNAERQVATQQEGSR